MLKNKEAKQPIVAGFTLIEVLIVVAIGALLVGFGLFGLRGYVGKQRVQTSLDGFTAALRETQQRAISQEEGSAWGVRLTNVSGVSAFEVFKGTDYLTGTVEQTYYLRQGTSFSGFPTSTVYDIPFAARTGATSEQHIISIVNNRKDSIVGIVTIGSAGTMSSQLETAVANIAHFDEASGTVSLDASGNDNNGTVSGAQWRTGSECKIGGCLLFNGTNAYVEFVDNVILRPKQLTVEAWFNTQNKNLYQAILSKKDASDFAITMNYTNPLYVACQSNAICFQINLIGDASTQDNYIKVDYPVSNISNNTWHHIVGTYDRQTLKLYFDGKLVDTNSTAGEIYYTNQPLCIGSEAGSEFGVPSCSDRGEEAGKGWFLGKIDEVRVYSRVLTAAEIFAHYSDVR